MSQTLHSFSIPGKSESSRKKRRVVPSLEMKLSCLLAHALLMHSASSLSADEKVFMPSLCAANGDPYCDPNWTPFANMNNALMGYDIVNGDQLARDGDPGFRSQIFGAVVTDKQGRMVLDDGISAIDLLECESNFDSKTVTNLAEFKEELSSSYEISADISGSYGGYSGSFGYKDNGSSKQAKEKMQSGETAIMLSEVECQLHKLRLNQELLPGFTNQFVAALKELATISTSSPLATRQKAFFKFWGDYGTHYITESRFGAKLVIETEFSKTETSERQLKEQEVCRGLSMGFSAPFMSAEASANGCASSSSDSNSANSNSRSLSQIISIGSKPGEDAEDWSDQDFDWPQIVSMDLAPISNLFQTKFLSKYDIDANKIRSWFTPLEKSFCANINAMLPASEKFPCSPPKGCGLDDKCGMNSVCKQGSSSSSYTCATSPAALKDIAATLVVFPHYDPGKQSMVYDLTQPGKKCKPLPNIPGYKKVRHGVVDIKGVPVILSNNVVYKYVEKKNAWSVIARTQCVDGWSNLYKLSGNRLWVINDNWDRCNFIIENGLARYGPTETKGDMNTFAVVPMGNDNFMIAAGAYGGGTTYDVHQVNLNTGKWTTLPKVSSSRKFGAGAMIDTPRGPEIFLLGGQSYKNVLIDGVEVYNVRQRKWRNGPKLPYYAKTNRPSVIPFQGTILVRAGDAKILQLNLAAMAWEMRPEMGVKDGQAAVIAAKLC